MALPLRYSLHNLRARWQVSLLAALGIALVIGVMVVLLAMVSGFSSALRATGRDDNAVVTQRGSNTELTSAVPRADAERIAVDARVARDAAGRPLASCELLVVAGLPRRADGRPANVALRGVGPRGFDVRAPLEIVQGRAFTPGTFEVMVGERIQRRVRGLELGSTLVTPRARWQVVGVFRARGSAFESEVWGDLDVMGPALNRSGRCNALVLRLADPGSLDAFDQELRARAGLQVQLTRERDYYDRQTAAVAGPVLGLAAFVALVMGLGAIFGGMNTMYASVAARTREVGTLRALGFSRASVLGAVVLESLALALVGGSIGCLLALPWSGLAAGTGQTQSYNEIAFALRIAPADLLAGLAAALVMGFAGGLLPAWRASRLPIALALREA
jgi:putative ABC transport system permease protein